MEQREQFFEVMRKQWGGPVGIDERAPSVADDPQFRDWWAVRGPTDSGCEVCHLVAGSGISFEDRGIHNLAGCGECQLFAVLKTRDLENV